MISQKKKRGPDPTGKGTPVMVRVHEPMLSAIDDFARKSEDISRPEAIRRILSDWLKENGYLGD